MTTQERRQLLEQAIRIYGATAQVNQLHEEMGELMVSISKNYRAGSTEETLAQVREELADVQIMLDQMRILFGETDGV